MGHQRHLQHQSQSKGRQWSREWLVRSLTDHDAIQVSTTATVLGELVRTIPEPIPRATTAIRVLNLPSLFFSFFYFKHHSYGNMLL
jgi:hypothetical protein